MIRLELEFMIEDVSETEATSRIGDNEEFFVEKDEPKADIGNSTDITPFAEQERRLILKIHWICISVLTLMKRCEHVI